MVNPTPTPPPSFWRRRILDPVKAQLTQGITPEKIALTIAVGSACALFPILGTTTLLCLLVGIVLRLNQPIIQVVNYLCTPIHIPLIFVCARMGEKIFGVQHVRFSVRFMNQLFWDDPAQFFHRFGTTVLHAVVAWAIATPFWIVLVYFTARTTLREIARVRAEAAAKIAASKLADPTNHPEP